MTDGRLDDYEERLRKGAVRYFIHRHKKRLLALCGLGALVWVGTCGSTWMIERADKSDTACYQRDFEGSPGASEGCAGWARAWLLVPSLVPWRRAAARETDLDIRQDVEDRAITRATQITLDAAARDAAIDRFLAISREPGFAPDRRTTDRAFSLAAATGAREVTARLGDLARGDFDRRRAVAAAIGAGDVGRAVALARLGADEPKAYEYHLVRGALLCLEGSAEEGRAALAQADAAYREAGISGNYAQAQVALYACGAPLGSQRNETYREVVLAAELLAWPDAAEVDQRLDPRARMEQRVDDNRGPFVAAWLLRKERPLEDVLQRVAPLAARSARALTPWLVSGPEAAGLVLSRMPLALDPERHERAAEALLALAARVDAGTLKPRPLELEGADREIRWDSDAERIARAVRASPALFLRRGAAALFLEAANARAGMFDRKGAARDVERALRDGRLDADEALFAGALLAWAGEPARAKEALAPALAAETRSTRLFAEVVVALVEMSAGQFDAAHEAAKRAQEHAAAITKGVAPGSLDEMVGESLLETAGWTLLATSLRAKRPADAPPLKGPADAESRPTLKTPKLFEGEQTDWATLVAADAATRRDARLRMHDPTISGGVKSALPAAIYVLREAASDGRDPDVWIDHVLPMFDARVNGATGMRARAEAARWRGDTGAAARWDARAAELERRFADPRRALLARLAGLD